ncbi:MAG: hypothetical protein WCR27_03310 [Eubacteriales bacterium]
MFKKAKIITLFFVLGVFLSFSSIAMAQSVSSATTYLGTVYGYTYTSNGFVETTSYGARGYSCITCIDSVVPVGYEGISCYVYNSAGTCVKYSPWSYNTSSVYSIGSMTGYYNVSGTYYRSKGSCKMYNGSDYTEKPSNYTPYLYY